MAFDSDETKNTPMTINNAQPAPKKQENLLLNLAFNIAAPAIILSKFSGESALGTTTGLIVALSFPLAYGLFDFVQRKHINVFSILGIISTLLTGTISLLKLDPSYIAIKEAAIPGIIFFLVLFSTWTPYPLVEKLIFNDSLFDLTKLKQRIQEKKAEKTIRKVLNVCSYIVAASFALSSALNYFLAKWVVVSAPGTEAYNEELGKMTALSYPVIALPSMIVMGIALFYLISQIQKITDDRIEHYLLAAKK